MQICRRGGVPKSILFLTRREKQRPVRRVDDTRKTSVAISVKGSGGDDYDAGPTRSQGTDPIVAEITLSGTTRFGPLIWGFFAQPRNQLFPATTSNVPQEEHRYASVSPVNGSRRR